VRQTALAVMVLAVVATTAAVAASGDTAQQILDSGALREQPSADLLEVLRSAGPGGLTAAQAETARNQLVVGLEDQTHGQIAEMMSGVTQGMGSMMRQGMAQALSPEQLLRQGLGIGGGGERAREQAVETRREMSRKLMDPWVRGLAAARALARVGHEEEAAAFYTTCLRFPLLDPNEGGAETSWVTMRCIDDAISLGGDTAGAIFVDVYDHAWPDVGVDLSAMGGKSPAMQPIPQIRAAAVLGLGRLVASGRLSGAQRRGVVDALIKWAQEADDDTVLDAAIRALAATGDTRAAEVLRGFAKVKLGFFSKLTHKGRRASHVSEDTRRRARRALAVAFRDPDAVDALHHELDHGEPADAARAAQALLEIDDPEAWRWVDHYLQRDRLKDGEPDFRQSVADSLVAAGGERAADVLHRAIAVHRHNDWIEAYDRIALLRLGDTSQLDRLREVATKTDWHFDLAGISSWYHRLKPLLQAAAKAATGAPSGDAWRTVLGFALAERDRAMAHKAKRERRTHEIRWALADALVTCSQPGALELLARLLDDPDHGVRLRAASALLEHDEPGAAPSLAHALELDYGAEEGRSRTGDVHAAVLRKLVETWPSNASTVAARRTAATLPSPAVRLLALVAVPASG